MVDRIVEEDPTEIVVVDNLFLGRLENLSDARAHFPNVEVVQIDAGDLSAMQDLVSARGIETVFDLAVIPLPTSLTFPAWTVMSNVKIATSISEILRRGLAENLVHFSSSEAYGTARYVPMDEGHPHDPLTPYAASKSASDSVIHSYVETFGINAITLRPFNIIGPRQNIGSYAGIVPIVISRVLSGQPIEIHGDGHQTRDLTFVRDMANFVIKVNDASPKPGTIVNIATGWETSINSLVEQILRVFGKPDYPIRYSNERPGDVRRHCGDVEVLKSLVGDSPPPVSDDALAETVESYLKGRS